MSADICTYVYSQVWQVLNNDATFAATFSDGNQIRFDQGSTTGNNSILRPQKSTNITADFPQIQMDIDGGNWTPYMLKTFAQEFAQYSGELIEEQTVRLKLTVTSQDQRYTTSGTATPGSNQLQSIVQNALRVAGPKLGINAVLNWGPIAWDRKIAKINGQMVNEDTMRLPVSMRFMGQNGVLIVP